MQRENPRNLYSHDEQELINKYKKLDKEDRLRVIERIESLLDMKKDSITAKPSHLHIVESMKETVVAPERTQPKLERIIYDPHASAGLGNYLYEDSSYEVHTFDANKIIEQADFGIRISGNSMEPEIVDGDIVWVKEQIQIENDQIGIFIYENEAYCKKLHIDYVKRKIYLVSLNEDYPPMEIEDENYLKTVGRVLK